MNTQKKPTNSVHTYGDAGTASVSRTALTVVVTVLTTAAVIMAISLVTIANRLGQLTGTSIGSAGGGTQTVAEAPAPAPAPSGDPNATCITGSPDISDEPRLGRRRAEVTIVEYSDYECPFCKRFFDQTYPQIKAKYIDTGMANLYFKDYPLNNIHPLATPAAVIANCIYQNRGSEEYFQYHDILFQRQNQWSPDALRQWGSEFITLDQIDACNADDSFTAEIQEDLREGSSFGVNGTPSFVINGELLIGARPYADFEAAIERALAGEGCES